MSAQLVALRQTIREAKFAAEDARVVALAAGLRLSAAARAAIESDAARLVEQVRARRGEHSVLDVFLKEFGLANEEGVALMCLAEALLRIPDAATVDALIADKILPGRWGDHIGNSESTFVNASTWALMLTGRVIALDNASRSPADVLGRLINRAGEPVIRNAMRRAMRILGGEFVLGRDIDEALRRGASEHGADGVFSFDMLGEGARTEDDAKRYFAAYAAALERVGGLAKGLGTRAGSGVSVKLSALHPRYEFAQRRRVFEELYPRLLELARRAAQWNVGLSIDAEEADRLELSLDLYGRLARAPELARWDGLGLVVQAYGKRALPVLDWLIELACDNGRSFQVRLVKGAYWDAEIKRAQETGMPDFPVFTQKANTDVAYLACAERLLAAGPELYPQFATHNAHTVAAVLAIARDAGKTNGFEFQRLHGMGELLYRVAAQQFRAFPRVRVYAPVGGHRDLLAYLVRRLLKNGANSSFVNRFLDAATPPREIVHDPVTLVARGPHRHPRIRLPDALYGTGRRNSPGLDLADAERVDALADSIALSARGHFFAAFGSSSTAPQLPVRNPAKRHDVVGEVWYATPADVDAAVRIAAAAQPEWDRLGGAERARCLVTFSDRLDADRDLLIALLVREGGKTLPDAIAEVREAIDYCRYYAGLAIEQFAEPMRLPGPTGEANQLSLHGRGVFACISPWNFPLAIFLGQITAALAAGNTVVAKPAEQTPLIGARAVELAVESGLPAGVVQLLPGDGAVGARLVSHPGIAGVAFTGGTDTARSINRALAARDGAILPLIAETGGQNAMFVDSTALLEQLTDDVMRSAFGSAGQRCSALRLLLLQNDVADRAVEMIRGAMRELRIGDPMELATDVGPLIEAEAVTKLMEYVAAQREAGHPVDSVDLPAACADGSFMAPHLIELDDFTGLTEEHFGPVLHVARFEAEELDATIEKVRGLGFGLTMGVHSRIDSRWQHIFERSAVGNTYVNRSIIGAVVGAQPFGGEGLSGTGPKAGGPHYLLRFATERALSVNTMAGGGNIDLLRG